MEARWLVDVMPYTGLVEDEYGNVVDSWAAIPVRKAVYGWAPAGTTEDSVSRHTVVSDVELFTPPDFTLDSRDHIRILGITYEVEGDVEDYTHGPFGYSPGGRVNLRRFSS